MPSLSHLPLQNGPEAESNKAPVHDIYIRESQLGAAKPGVLFPLGKGCSTVRTSSLSQGETADEPKGEQDDGQEDAQEGEGVLQDPDSAEGESGTRVRALGLMSQRTRPRTPALSHTNRPTRTPGASR